MAIQSGYPIGINKAARSKKLMKPLVSVIIPAYNHADFLPTCIESISRQSDGMVEIIVVDDGSTDNTEEVVNNFRNIKYNKQSNSGPSVARNRGLAIAEGRFVAFLDADDIWLGGFLATLLPVLENCNENIALVACGWRYIDIRGDRIGADVLVEPQRFNWRSMILGNPLTVSSALCRLETIQKVGGFDPAIKGVEDWYLWLKLIDAGHQFASVAESLVGYRIVKTGISHNVQGMFENTMRLLDRVFTELDPPKDVINLRAQSIAYRYLDGSAGYYQNHLDAKAESFFQQGVAVWPELLKDAHTVYTLVCARQPKGYKLSGEFLELRDAEQRVKGLLVEFSNQYPTYVKTGIGNLYMVLARLAHVQKKYGMARQFASQAIVADPRQQGLNFLRTWTKSLLSKES